MSCPYLYASFNRCTKGKSVCEQEGNIAASKAWEENLQEGSLSLLKYKKWSVMHLLF